MFQILLNLLLMRGCDGCTFYGWIVDLGLFELAVRES